MEATDFAYNVGLVFYRMASKGYCLKLVKAKARAFVVKRVHLLYGGKRTPDSWMARFSYVSRQFSLGEIVPGPFGAPA